MVVIFVGVFVFVYLFVVNLVIYFYLVVKYVDGNKVVINVGFYYMVNVFGWFIGIIISGVFYFYVGFIVEGFVVCFWVSLVFVLIFVAFELYIDDDAGGFWCGFIKCIGDDDFVENDVELM